MGQCYSVTMELDYKDSRKVVDALNAYIDETDGRGVRYDLSHDRTKLPELMKVFLTDRDYTCDEEGKSFSSAFDASYGWDDVLRDMFESLAPVLDDGSYMEVWPDSGNYLLTVAGGAVIESEVPLVPDDIKKEVASHISSIFKQAEKLNEEKPQEAE